MGRKKPGDAETPRWRPPERHPRLGGGIYNTGIAIENSSGAEITLFATSLDYCGQILKANARRVELHACHVGHNLPRR